MGLVDVFARLVLANNFLATVQGGAAERARAVEQGPTIHGDRGVTLV